MFYRSTLRMMAQAAVLLLTISGARAFDDSKYPDLQGQWDRFAVAGVRGQPSFDQTKSWGRGQEAPLTPEYQKIFEASLADRMRAGRARRSTTRAALPPACRS